MNSRFVSAIIGIAFVLFVIAPQEIHADSLTSHITSTTDKNSTIYTYSYTFAPVLAHGEFVSELEIDVDSDAALFSIEMPSGWQALYNPTNPKRNNAISFGATTTESFLTASSTATFTFKSKLAPGPQPYYIQIFDPSGVGTHFIQATTSAPSKPAELASDNMSVSGRPNFVTSQGTIVLCVLLVTILL